MFQNVKDIVFGGIVLVGFWMSKFLNPRCRFVVEARPMILMAEFTQAAIEEHCAQWKS
jgi:hypothetical protein